VFKVFSRSDSEVLIPSIVVVYLGRDCASQLLEERLCSMAVARRLGLALVFVILLAEHVSANRKYLIATFPSLRQVGYTVLPDNVWRPLVVGKLSTPQAVAVDGLNRRVYVSDPPEDKIYWYALYPQIDGLLRTDGVQHVAVEGFKAKWLAVNGMGDLYFSGGATDGTAGDGIFRKNAVDIASGNTLNTVEVYSRANSGSPNPKVWMPSGIAVDSFYIYWGNQEKGTSNGAVVRGSRQNIKKTSDIQLQSMTNQMDEVRGMAVTGTLLYYLAPGGIFAAPKTQTAQTTMAATTGLISARPSDAGTPSWDPKSIAWDGDHTMFVGDNLGGRIYTLPTDHIGTHVLVKFADAPHVWGVGVLDCSGPSNLAQVLQKSGGTSRMVLHLALMSLAITLLRLS